MNVRGRCSWLTTMVLLAVFVAACAKKVHRHRRRRRRSHPAKPAPPPPPPPPPAPKPTPPPPPAPLSEGRAVRAQIAGSVNAEMPLGDVSFEYDQSTVRDDQRATLQKNADWMRRWTTTRVSIEGHADARGTNEYNLALGDRRARAVMDYMVSLGIAADRMAVVSKGEEAPLCTEMTEACYARNRRGHFVITAK
jgi:peptidoglycan-associated lipoprotein